MKWRKEKRDPMEFRRKFIWWPISITGVDGSINWYWFEALLATDVVAYQDGGVRYFKNLDWSDI